VAPRPRIGRVDDGGLVLLAVDDRPVDVCLDGRRIWTFWTLRDTDRVGPVPGPLRRIAWPRPLVRFLHGRTRLTLRDPGSELVFLDREVSLGEGEGRIDVRNQQGVELGFDKSGKLVPTFAGRPERDISALLDATEAVLAALQEAGLEPFLAYGTLLGAVREGQVLGHDSDADLGYVSRYTTPVDVARESFRVQRWLAERGWSTTRYSGAAFKVLVTPEPGVQIGLDVFGGFLDAGRLYLMGEIGSPFEDSWIHPLGSCELGGRPMPVPARPEKLLEATYGPGWRVPDPAFKFTTPPRTVRALEDWFRGTQPGIRLWERRASVGAARGFRDPSLLARRAAAVAAERGAEVLDVGAGRGADSLWLAQQGVHVTAYDYAPRALRHAERRAHTDGHRLEVRHLNLTEWRSVLAEGARLAHDPRPRVVLARHVLDATSGVGREAFVRLCAMAMRARGGVLLADLHLADEADEAPEPLEWMVGQVDLASLTRLLERAGATRIEVKRLEQRSRPTVRLVGEWTDAEQGRAATVVDDGGGTPAGAAGR
jgi:2-polyprenyl-3-methyl-5-hydroxy-6-metoxy-1,4-benzoquinol methylase